MIKKVLVVDDNPVSRELVREVLSSPDLEVLEAADGNEALRMISVEMPNVVLLDIRMPVLTGFDVLREIRRDPKYGRIRVLAFTAFAMREEREKAIAAGFDGYVTKPIDPSLLRSQIESQLRS